MPRDMLQGDDDEDQLAGTGLEDDHDADGPADEGDEPALDPSGQPIEVETAPPAPRPDRQARRAARAEGFAERERIANERAADLERRLEEMTAQVARSAEASTRVADAVSRGVQRPTKTALEVAQEELIAAAAEVTDTPASQAKFLREQVAIQSRMQAAQQTEAMEQFRRTMPQAPPPHIQALIAKAPWLDPNTVAGQSHGNGINTTIGRIADKRGIAFNRASPELKDQIVNQAIAEYGAFMGLPVNLPARAPGNAAAVTGGGSRSFSSARAGAGGGGPASQLSPLQRALADNHPVYKEMPKEKRYPAFSAMIKRESSSRG